MMKGITTTRTARSFWGNLLISWSAVFPAVMVECERVVYQCTALCRG